LPASIASSFRGNRVAPSRAGMRATRRKGTKAPAGVRRGPHILTEARPRCAASGGPAGSARAYPEKISAKKSSIAFHDRRSALAL